MQLVMAIPVTMASIYASIRIIQKTLEPPPDKPVSPEEHKKLREQTLCFAIIPHEQEAIHKS